jgi:hypothetical protein
MKEFLVEFDVNVPEGTPESEVEQRERAEAAAAADLLYVRSRSVRHGPAEVLARLGEGVVYETYLVG